MYDFPLAGTMLNQPYDQPYQLLPSLGLRCISIASFYQYKYSVMKGEINQWKILIIFWWIYTNDEYFSVLWKSMKTVNKNWPFKLEYYISEIVGWEFLYFSNGCACVTQKFYEMQLKTKANHSKVQILTSITSISTWMVWSIPAAILKVKTSNSQVILNNNAIISMSISIRSWI